MQDLLNQAIQNNRLIFDDKQAGLTATLYDNINYVLILGFEDELSEVYIEDEDYWISRKFLRTKINHESYILPKYQNLGGYIPKDRTRLGIAVGKRGAVIAFAY